LADHGFTTLTTEVDLNAWLKEHGFLHLEASPEGEWDSRSMTSRTRAFALDPGRVYIHTRDRFARGGVPPLEAAPIRDAVRQGLMELTSQGSPVFEAIRTGEELYPGSPHPDTPDLVCIPRPGFDLKAKFDRREVFGFFGRTGTHTHGDVFFAADSPGDVSRVRDVGSLVLETFEQSRIIVATT
jgi:predicted AlkP superfamily phosphohydrolase/phosphomutase